MRDLVRINSLKEAVRKDGILLAGGTEVLRLNSPLKKDMPLIDILPFLSDEIRKDGEKLSIGSAATFASILSCPYSPEYLKEAVSYMPSPQLRNQATIGGNIASWRDDSYLIPTLSASGAVLFVLNQDGKEESIPIMEYCKKGGIILSVSIRGDEKVRNFREGLTSHSHAVVTASFSSKSECYAIKGSGIFFSLEHAEFCSDMYGSAEYKSYLASLYRKESGRA